MLRSKKFLFTLLVLTIFIDLSRSEDPECIPEQIRLSFGDLYFDSKSPNIRLPSDKSNSNHAYLSWLTKTKTVCEFNVSISDERDLNKEATKKKVSFNEKYFYDFALEIEGEKRETYTAVSYTVNLDNMKYDNPYKYTITETKTNKTYGPFNFTLTSPEAGTNSKKFVVLGGIDNSEKGNLTIKKLIDETKDKNYAGLVHLGSFSQNLHDNDGKSGDIFYKSIQDITVRLPYIVTPGKSDGFNQWKLFNFRTKNPAYSKTHNHYFSFSVQGIHFVAVNFDYYANSEHKVKTEMLSWIEEDLKEANEEEHHKLCPWIVVISNSPIYCLNNDKTLSDDRKCNNYYAQKKDFDALLNKYGVDLMISTHHNYERMGPITANQTGTYNASQNDQKKNQITDPKGTVHIIESSNGNKEKTETDYNPGSYGYVVDKNSGYGVLYTTKAQTEEFKLIYEHYNSDGEVVDTMNIIKTHLTSHRSHNKTPYFLFVVLMAVGVVVVTFTLIAIRRKKLAMESEDNIPLNTSANSSSSPMRSNRLRYTRPGEKGIKMVDLVLC